MATNKLVLAAVGAAIGSSLLLGGCTSSFAAEQAGAVQQAGAAAPLDALQGVARPDLPVDAPAGVDPAGPAGPSGASGPVNAPVGLPVTGQPVGPSDPDQSADPRHGVDPVDQPGPDAPMDQPGAPGPGDPLYDPPIHPGRPPIGPGHPLYDPPLHVVPDPIVRDHRDGVEQDPADAPGGVTVTPSNGGPIIRDHRHGGPTVRDHRD